MLKTIRWLATGAAIGLAVDRTWLELQKPQADQFPWLRMHVNRDVNPWVMEHGLAGGAKAEIGTLRHVGRSSGAVHLTPVHPTVRGDTLLIPAPLGAGSQWARNVLHAGTAELVLKETLYELDRPELITVTEAGMVPPQVAAPFDHLGWRYVRLHVVESRPGSFETSPDAVPEVDTTGIPVEPRMVEREGALA